MADVVRKVEMALKKAWTLVEAKQLELGLKAFDDAAAADPENDAIPVEKGVALFRVGRPAEALAAFERAVTLNAKNMTARANAAKMLGQLGRRDDALAAYEAGLALEATSFALLLGCGTALHEAGRHEDAILRFELAVAAKPREGEPWFRKALAKKALGDRDAALAAFAEACALRPKYVDALRERAVLLRELGRMKEAWTQVLDAVKAAGEASPIELLCVAAETALEVGQAADALKCAEKALEKSKEAAPAWLLKARAQEKLGNPSGAALAEGTGHMVAGRLPEALAALERALQVEPRYTAAWCNRAVVLERMERLEDAVKCYERALEIDPGNALLWHNKGNLLWGKLGRRDEAVRCYKRETKIDHRRWFDLAPEVRAEVDKLL